MEVIHLHRYLIGRRGRIEIDEGMVRFEVPVFATPLAVALADIEGTAMVEPTAMPPYPMPQRSGGPKGLIQANLAIRFRRPQPTPPIAGVAIGWKAGVPLPGLCLRVKRPDEATEAFERAGIPYLEDL